MAGDAVECEDPEFNPQHQKTKQKCTLCDKSTVYIALKVKCFFKTSKTGNSCFSSRLQLMFRAVSKHEK